MPSFIHESLSTRRNDLILVTYFAIMALQSGASMVSTVITPDQSRKSLPNGRREIEQGVNHQSSFTHFASLSGGGKAPTTQTSYLDLLCEDQQYRLLEF